METSESILQHDLFADKQVSRNPNETQPDPPPVAQEIDFATCTPAEFCEYQAAKYGSRGQR